MTCWLLGRDTSGVSRQLDLSGQDLMFLTFLQDSPPDLGPKVRAQIRDIYSGNYRAGARAELWRALLAAQ